MIKSFLSLLTQRLRPLGSLNQDQFGGSSVQFSSLLSPVRLFETPWTVACQASLSINPQSLLKLMSIELVMPSNHFILCCSLLFLPSIFLIIRVFSKQSVLHIRWPKYWSFSPSNEYSGLISIRMDWFDLLAVQGTLKSLLQHHNSKASVLRHSAFFMVQLSHSYMTTGKIIALTRRTFVGQVMSLLFNMLSKLVIAFLPRNKCLLILWLQSPSAVILEPPKIKSLTVFPIYLPWSDGTRCHDLSLLNVEFQAIFSLSSFTFIKRLFSSSSLSAIRVVSAAYLRLLKFLPEILIAACASLSPAFLMIYSAYKLNQRGDDIQPFWTIYSFPDLEPVCCSMSSSNSCFLTCVQVSQEAGQVVWYSHLFQNFPQYIAIHTVKGFGIVNKAEVDVFLELFCFFNDPRVVGNLISGSLNLILF